MQTATPSEVVRPRGSLPSSALSSPATSEPCFQASVFPVGSSHLFAQETLSGEMTEGGRYNVHPRVLTGDTPVCLESKAQALAPPSFTRLAAMEFLVI